MNPKVICLDTETTGVDPKRDEVLTLSIIDGEGNVLFDRMFKPERTTAWPSASKVNRIYPEDVEGCAPIGESLGEIDAILADATRIVGYNLNFDLGFLDAAGACIPETGVEFWDPMVLFAELYGEWNPRRGEYKWQKLTKAAEFTGYEWDGAAHGSLADARATLAVLAWCIDTRDKKSAVLARWREAVAYAQRQQPGAAPGEMLTPGSLELGELLDEEFPELSISQRKAIMRSLPCEL